MQNYFTYLKIGKSHHSKSHRPLQQHLSYRDRELWPVTLTFDLELDSAKVNQRSKYMGKKSSSSKVIVDFYTFSNFSFYTSYKR